MDKEKIKREGKEMEENFQVIDRYLMIRMPEEIDHHMASLISAEADRYILGGDVYHVVFDFEDTRFMDSSGIGIVMGRYKKIACFGGQVFAIHADERIKKMIGMSGLKKILQIVGQEDTDE